MKLKNFTMITEDKVTKNFANYQIFNGLYFIELTLNKIDFVLR